MNQSSTEVHHSTKSLLERLSKFRYWRTGESNMSTKERLDQLLEEFHRRGIEQESLEGVRKRLFTTPDHLNRTYVYLTQDYEVCIRYNELAVDAKRVTDRNELKVHIRGLIFRGLTTLTIGGAIMFIYWLAARWGIQLPLLRIPV
ncbi:MAG TPA: hypothetical protein DDZ61_06300 [Aeromonas salmonicida]|nr:hypothetical protein [Aeromonas salmonicida]HBL02213.1 hypothetical protein [Aeromonas salmonicida]